MDEKTDKWVNLFTFPWALSGFTLWRGPKSNEIMVCMGGGENGGGLVSHVLAINIATQSYRYLRSLAVPRANGCAWPTDKGWSIIGGNDHMYFVNFESNAELDTEFKDKENLEQLFTINLLNNLNFVSSSIQTVTFETAKESFNLRSLVQSNTNNFTHKDFGYIFFELTEYKYVCLVVFHKQTYDCKLLPLP